jgi:hypothetical protein
MVRDAALGGLVGVLVMVGCSSGHHEPKAASSSWNYTANFEANPNPPTVEPEPQEKAPGPPRLVRKDDEVTRKLDSSAAATPTATDPHALRAPAIGGGPPPTVEPSTSLPSPPARLSTPVHVGVDEALRAVPRGVPTGHLNRDALEGPLRDRAKFDRCGVPKAADIQIDAVIYNGAAVGVDVRANPRDQALEFCIEQIVRETSWVQERAVNRVSLKL